MRFTSTPIVPFALLNAVFAGVAVSKPTFNQDSVSQRDSVNIEKRVDNASLTFYSFPQGSVGACGSAISPNDFVSKTPLDNPIIVDVAMDIGRCLKFSRELGQS
jgi:hypothetical protein